MNTYMCIQTYICHYRYLLMYIHARTVSRSSDINVTPAIAIACIYYVITKALIAGCLKIHTRARDDVGSATLHNVTTLCDDIDLTIVYNISRIYIYIYIYICCVYTKCSRYKSMYTRRNIQDICLDTTNTCILITERS